MKELISEFELAQRTFDKGISAYEPSDEDENLKHIYHVVESDDDDQDAMFYDA